MTIFAVNAKVSTEVKTAIDNLQAKSEVTAHLFYVGAPPDMQPALSARQDDSALIQVKNVADSFYQQAQRHEWKR